MLLPILLLHMAVILQQSLGQEALGHVGYLSEQTKERIVDNINSFRREVKPTASNMLQMTWSEEAAENTKHWARKCQPRTSPKTERMVNGILCGESRIQTTYSMSWSDVIEVWQSKESNFKFGIGAIDPQKDIYGYTQLVWYNSHQIGCALAFCPQNDYPFLYFCHYCPAGNIVEMIPTPYKEGPSCGDCPQNCEEKLCTNPCMYSDKHPDCLGVITLFSCKNQYFQNLCEATCKCPQGTIF